MSCIGEQEKSNNRFFISLCLLSCIVNPYSKNKYTSFSTTVSTDNSSKKKKKFWKIPSSNSSILCITAFLLWFVFLSHVSFQAVPNASQKDQEKLLLQKHQEKLWSIILLLLPQARWTPLYCSLPLTISSILVVRKWWDLWKYRCTELFCPVCQYVQFLEYYIIIISTWEVYLTTDMQGQKGKKKKKGGGQVEKDHGNLITNDENNTLMKDLSFPSTTETM